MLNTYVNFSIMKKLLDVAHEKLINIKGRHGVLDMFLDISHILEMAICVVNQLKNDSYILLGTVGILKIPRLFI